MPNRNTLFIGKVSHCFPTLDSTNRYAQELLATSKPTEGTTVVTYHQTAGRGQAGSTWEGEPGKNIAFSVVFYPHFLPVSRQFLLNKAVALGVLDLLFTYLDRPVAVKWPNDLYVGGCKVAGILIQNVLSGRRFASSIVGIGLNVNQAVFPPSLPNPTSMRLESGQSYALEPLVDELCYRLERRYLQLRQGAFAALRSDYRRHLYRLGESTRFERPGGAAFTGRISGVNEQGKLLVDRAGDTEAFDLKMITYR